VPSVDANNQEFDLEWEYYDYQRTYRCLLVLSQSQQFFYPPDRWLRITVFLVVTSPYTAVYDEIRHENGPYSTVILVTVYNTAFCALFFDQDHCYFIKL
jgi:hypothetical protein